MGFREGLKAKTAVSEENKCFILHSLLLEVNIVVEFRFFNSLHSFAPCTGTL